MAKTSKAFLDGISQLADDLRRQIDANLQGWDLAAPAVAERRRKVLDPVSGFEFFDRTYFPHYGTAEPSDLHRYLYRRLPQVVNAATG